MSNREIKFRAWDEELGIMCYCELSSAGNYQNMSSVPLMQYTGLKDKNGKEIYEGDIVSYGLDEHPCVIEFKYACFYISSTDNIDHHLGYYRVYNIEVVGNIYENPDLIGE
jgi:hypothetical protein